MGCIDVSQFHALKGGEADCRRGDKNLKLEFSGYFEGEKTKLLNQNL